MYNIHRKENVFEKKKRKREKRRGNTLGTLEPGLKGELVKAGCAKF